MNWITLRKSNVHLVDRQIERVIALHQQLRESIMQGDILSVQKMSQLQLSIKKRIQQMNDFYNQNCLDQRVRYLQGAQMKLARLINSSILVGKDDDLTINLPNKKDISGSRNGNKSPKKSTTPQKIQNFKDQASKSFIRNQVSKSPISRPKVQKPNKFSTQSKKPNISLQIPQQSPQSHITFSGVTAKTQQSKPYTEIKTGRKTQIMPNKNSSYQQNSYNKNISASDKMQQTKNYKINIKQPITSPQPASSSRSRVTNLSARNRTLTESNNMSSMKKLNDLIFTIKMTKQEYQDFMQIKKNLEQG